MGFLKGQGATEYLVLLAVVLIIALVSIALLGFFPSVSTDTRIVQSQTYWRGTARPFAIIDSSITTGGAGNITLQNYEAQGALTITNLNIGGSTNVTSTTFQPGEIKTMTLTGSAFPGSPSQGTPYEHNVTISYNNPYGFSGTQRGGKGLAGRYN